MLYKVVLTFESVDEIVQCDHSNESYWAVLAVVVFILLYKVIQVKVVLAFILSVKYFEINNAKISKQ